MITLGSVLERLLAILKQLEIPYLIGGSIASGAYGLPRQTNDIDIVADFHSVDISAFCDRMRIEFYIDTQQVLEAVRAERPFNAIHTEGAFKFDFFPAGKEGFTQSELSRKRYVISALPGPESIEFAISSPEDTVLAKLLWFRKGGEVSDRQWHDILGILSVQRDRLDYDYLTGWAATLNVSDLLHSALRQSSSGL